jgi:hypothetical protein
VRLTAFFSPNARVVQGIRENTWGFKAKDGRTVFDVEEHEKAKNR